MNAMNGGEATMNILDLWDRMAKAEADIERCEKMVSKELVEMQQQNVRLLAKVGEQQKQIEAMQKDIYNLRYRY